MSDISTIFEKKVFECYNHILNNTSILHEHILFPFIMSCHSSVTSRNIWFSHVFLSAYMRIDRCLETHVLHQSRRRCRWFTLSWDLSVFSIAWSYASHSAYMISAPPHSQAMCADHNTVTYMHIFTYNMVFLKTDVCSNNSYAISVHFCWLNCAVVVEYSLRKEKQRYK